jgi:hypothetical protein
LVLSTRTAKKKGSVLKRIGKEAAKQNKQMLPPQNSPIPVSKMPSLTPGSEKIYSEENKKRRGNYDCNGEATKQIVKDEKNQDYGWEMDFFFHDSFDRLYHRLAPFPSLRTTQKRPGKKGKQEKNKNS